MFAPSKYQQEVFRFIREERGNGFVEAVAGSGKTTTIVESLSKIPSHYKVLFCAFNKHIANELARRVPSNVEASTLNSLGMKVLCKNYRYIKIDPEKIDKILFFEILNRDNTLKWQVSPAIIQLISLAKSYCVYSSADLISKLDWFINRFDINLPSKIDRDQFIDILVETFNKSINKTSVVDFNDQLYFPIYKNLQFNRYDLVMVDEAQDLNPIQIEMIKELSRFGRIIAVGDRNQAIYGFRGSDPEAVLSLTDALDATILPLSICYRCGKNIVNSAKEIVPQIESSELAPEGEIRSIDIEQLHEEVSSGDYILCRVTADLIKECLKFIKDGKKAIVLGRNIGESLISLLEKIKETNGKDFPEKLHNYYEKVSAKLIQYNQTNKLMILQDKCDCLIVLYSRALELGKDANAIPDIIEDIFSDEKSSITLTTIHRAKGLESDKIFILRPDLLPHPMASQDWEIQQENNLKYVAITRAKKELIWVNGTRKKETK